jgi:hypothetical protein
MMDIYRHYSVMDISGLHQPKASQDAVRDLETALSRYRSVENKRIALRQAIEAYPNDPRIRQMIEQLTSIEHIRAALQRGIFISYARQDEVFALELSDRLKQASLRVWLDILDVRDGSEWHSEVRRGLEQCGMMIAVFSSNALTDIEIITERQAFDAMGKLILPVICERCDFDEKNFWLPVIDFSRDFEMGLFGIKRLFLPAPAASHV